MRVGSLFSGIGGLDLGLERAGMEIAWQVEIDEWCRRVLAKHWPDVPKFGDVGALTGDELEAVDLICGGFPCQPVSHAGRRMGESDSRWLWPEFYRIICEVRPRWVLAENVPGLLSMDSGRLFGGILRDLSEAGYDAVWFVLSAADVGAPHLRERVFVMAHTRQRDGRPGRPGRPEHSDQGLRESERTHKDVAHASGSRQRAEQRYLRARESDASRGGALAHAASTRQSQQVGPTTSVFDREALESARLLGAARKSWLTEPDVGRVAHGVPSRVDRLRGLGNAVVPQVAEWVGRWIVMAEAVP